jgi:hypothetical protein
MFVRFEGISGTAYPRFDMVPFPAERRITNLDVEGYAPDGGENEWNSLVIDLPGASGFRLSRLTLEKKFNEVLFIGSEHG